MTTRHHALDPIMTDTDEKPFGPEGLPYGSEHILVVDDEDVLAAYAKRHLEEFGYTVTSWSSGELALREFWEDQDRYAAIVTDQTMPGMSGVDLVTRIGRTRPDMAVVFTSGWYDMLSPEEKVALHVQRVLRKPYTGLELAVVVRDALDTAAQARRNGHRD